MSLSNDDIKQLIGILQKALVSDSSDESDQNVETEQVVSKSRKKVATKQKKTSSNQASESYNKFDSMPERTMHKEDIAVDKLLIKHPPTERSREFAFIDVQCRVCGRKESVNPALVYEAPDRYKCNKCSSTPG